MASNRHSVVLTGDTLREIAERAAGIFDVFFNREVAWAVTRFDSDAHILAIKDGAGVIVQQEVTSWTAILEAEAAGLYIGAEQGEPAMLFRPLGS